MGDKKHDFRPTFTLLIAVLMATFSILGYAHSTFVSKDTFSMLLISMAEIKASINELRMEKKNEIRKLKDN